MPLSFNEYMELGKFVMDSLGGLGEGAAKGRVEEGQLGVQQGQLAVNEQELALLGAKYANDANLQRYIQQINAGELDLRQRQFQLTAPSERARQAVMGDVMANVRDVQATGLPEGVPDINFEGGLRPSLLGPNSRAFGRELSRQALLNQMPSGVGAGIETTPLSGQLVDTKGTAQEIATAPGGIAGPQSPLVNRVTPRGDLFSPLGPAPPVTGFGGPMEGGGGDGGGRTPREGPRLGKGAGGRQYRDSELEGYARAPSPLTGTGMSGLSGGDPRNGLGVMGLFHPAAAFTLGLDKLLGGRILGPRGGAEAGGGAEWGPPEDLAYNPQEMGTGRDNQFGWDQPPTGPGFLDPNLRVPLSGPRNRATGSSWIIPQVE